VGVGIDADHEVVALGVEGAEQVGPGKAPIPHEHRPHGRGDQVGEQAPQLLFDAILAGPAADLRGGGRVWRHQVVELLPLTVRVTEYQMGVRRCPHCGQRTRAELPPGVPRRPFGPRLTAVVALLSARYRLSRREVQQLLRDVWQMRLSLGAVVGPAQAPSAAQAPRRVVAQKI
jgi:hypothetical protein